MNNYWFTNFRAFQEGGFSWSYQITSTADTTNTFATKYAWGERNPYLSRTFPAGEKSSAEVILQTLSVTGSQNVMIVNARPLFKTKGTILIHLRELEGMPAEIKLTSLIPRRAIKRIYEVNATGQKTGDDLSSIGLKPFEVKFVEVVF
jgi:hypothetical protein